LTRRVAHAVQREAVHRGCGIFADAEFETIPVLQRITSCCAARGIRELRSGE